MIRVLIVEDSITQREILRRLLSSDNQFLVVAEAANGRQAVEMVPLHRPDVVLMDIHMPDMDGIVATREIMRVSPVPIVIASATLKKRDVDLAMQGYAAGAVSVIEKPDGAVLLHLDKIGPALRRELLAAARVRQKRPRPGATASGCAPNGLPSTRVPPARRHFTPSGTAAIKVIGICASTGGPPVLLEIFSALSRPFSLPVLLVQHISRNFEDGFARWLTQASGQRVSVAVAGQRLEPGIWIAPSGAHLTVASTSRLVLRPGDEASIHCPSGDPLFTSLAKHVGPAAAGILLTGMGSDGAQGLRALRQAGGTTIIQDEASCLIWGMPRAAAQLEAADFELCPTEIARAIMEMARR